MANSSFFQNAVEKANKKPATTVERLAEAYNKNTQRESAAVETPVLDSAVKQDSKQAFSPAFHQNAVVLPGFFQLLRHQRIADLRLSASACSRIKYPQSGSLPFVFTVLIFRRHKRSTSLWRNMSNFVESPAILQIFI